MIFLSLNRLILKSVLAGERMAYGRIMYFTITRSENFDHFKCHKRMSQLNLIYNTEGNIVDTSALQENLALSCKVEYWPNSTMQ